MARNFDAGADVAVGGGAVFVNPEVGDHDALLTGVVHIGSFQDVFMKGKVEDPKKPCNYVLLQCTLMGERDKNEDGSRMVMWKSMALKSGDKAEMTAFLDALDPKELTSGMDDLIMTPFSAKMKGSDEKGDDGLPLYVNWTGKGFAGISERVAPLILQDAEKEGITPIGHVKFNDLTKEVLDEIPAHLVRQYFLSEMKGNNLSYVGSHVEGIINAAREADPEWKKAKPKDAKPEDKKPLDEGSQQSVPEPQNVPAPEMSSDEEY